MNFHVKFSYVEQNLTKTHWDTIHDWLQDEIGEDNWNWSWRQDFLYFNTEESKIKFILRWL